MCLCVGFIILPIKMPPRSVPPWNDTLIVSCSFSAKTIQTATSGDRTAWDKWSQWSQSHSDIRSRFLKQKTLTKKSEWSWWTHEFSGLKIIDQLCGPFAGKRAIDVVECIILTNVPIIRLRHQIAWLRVSGKQVQPREWKGYNLPKLSVAVWMRLKIIDATNSGRQNIFTSRAHISLVSPPQEELQSAVILTAERGWEAGQPGQTDRGKWCPLTRLNLRPELSCFDPTNLGMKWGNDSKLPTKSISISAKSSPANHKQPTHQLLQRFQHLGLPGMTGARCRTSP